jgi:hypothetical protein
MEIRHSKSGRKLDHSGCKFTGGIGRFRDGWRAKIFLNGANNGRRECEGRCDHRRPVTSARRYSGRVLAFLDPKPGCQPRQDSGGSARHHREHVSRDDFHNDEIDF